MKIKWIILFTTAILAIPMLSFSQQYREQKERVGADSLKIQAVVPQPKPVLGKYDYYDHLGTACKAEFKLEKATKIPFRFRLGSLQQTDYMEQKPNAQKPD